MERISRIPIALILALGITRCGLFDSGRPWSDGNFALIWIDDPSQVTLSVQRGPRNWSVLVPEQVYSVGSDANFIVAKQHPQGDRTIVNFWIIDKSKAGKSAISGPLSQSAFIQQASSLRLPSFSKTLSSLE